MRKQALPLYPSSLFHDSSDLWDNGAVNISGDIIDIHVHPLEGGIETIPGQIRSFEHYGRRTGIRRFCLLGHVCLAGYDPTLSQVRALNDQTIAFVERRPDLFSGFCYLNPRHSPRALEREFHRCVSSGPLRGVKLWVAVNCTDPKVDTVFHLAEAASVPILHHAWYKTVDLAFNESSPADIAQAAARFPGVTLIMAHLTGAGVRGILDIQPHPRVLVDTSGSQPANGMVEYAVSKLGPERLLFGSDASGRDFSVQIARVQSSRISEKAKRLILGGNAANVLRLGDDDG